MSVHNTSRPNSVFENVCQGALNVCQGGLKGAAEGAIVGTFIASSVVVFLGYLRAF